MASSTDSPLTSATELAGVGFSVEREVPIDSASDGGSTSSISLEVASDSSSSAFFSGEAGLGADPKKRFKIDPAQQHEEWGSPDVDTLHRDDR